MRTIAADSENLLRWWNLLRSVPGGSYIFSWLVGKIVPYTHSIRGRVLELEKGSCRVLLKDAKRVRNHLGSIHAMALANHCEMASGLALITALPPHSRGILKEFSIQYLKKARGDLIAESDVMPLLSNEAADISVEVSTKNAEGDVVAQAQALWRIGPA